MQFAVLDLSTFAVSRTANKSTSNTWHLSWPTKQLLSDADNSNYVFLPKHMRCASHTLRLSARTDFSKNLCRWHRHIQTFGEKHPSKM